MTLAVLIFIAALALIASERVHRTKVALLGATLAVLFVSEFDQERAIESVDFNTIGLLAGIMILVYLTQQTGVYDYVAIRAGQLSKGEPLRVVSAVRRTLERRLGREPELVEIAERARAANRAKFDEARTLLARARDELTGLGAVIRPDAALKP